MDRRVKLRKLLDPAGAGLIALVLGAALSMVLSDAFSLAAFFKQVLLTCAVTALEAFSTPHVSVRPSLRSFTSAPPSVLAENSARNASARLR